MCNSSREESATEDVLNFLYNKTIVPYTLRDGSCIVQYVCFSKFLEFHTRRSFDCEELKKFIDFRIMCVSRNASCCNKRVWMLSRAVGSVIKFFLRIFRRYNEVFQSNHECIDERTIRHARAKKWLYPIQWQRKAQWTRASFVIFSSSLSSARNSHRGTHKRRRHTFFAIFDSAN